MGWLWASMMRGDEEDEREWMVEAKIVDGRRGIVDIFRETRNLFLTSRVGCFFLRWG